MMLYIRILCLINISLFLFLPQICAQSNQNNIDKDWEVFPILNYNTDVSFGKEDLGIYFNFGHLF